jgi:hypothetical protein
MSYQALPGSKYREPSTCLLCRATSTKRIAAWGHRWWIKLETKVVAPDVGLRCGRKSFESMVKRGPNVVLYIMKELMEQSLDLLIASWIAAGRGSFSSLSGVDALRWTPVLLVRVWNFCHMPCRVVKVQGIPMDIAV